MGIVSKIAPAVLGAGVMLVAGGAAGEDEANPAPAPTFVVEQQTIDLGEVRAGDDAVAVFRYRNTGSTDVRIVRAKPS